MAAQAIGVPLARGVSERDDPKRGGRERCAEHLDQMLARRFEVVFVEGEHEIVVGAEGVGAHGPVLEAGQEAREQIRRRLQLPGALGGDVAHALGETASHALVELLGPFGARVEEGGGDGDALGRQHVLIAPPACGSRRASIGRTPVRGGLFLSPGLIETRLPNLASFARRPIGWPSRSAAGAWSKPSSRDQSSGTRPFDVFSFMSPPSAWRWAVPYSAASKVSSGA